MAKLSFCLCFLLLGLRAAHAADTVFLEDLTWTELRDQIRSGKTTVIVPIGGTEQNGPHMALGKHNVRVRYLSEKIARALGNALVAPVIAYVPEGALAPPSAHMRFPGTITVPEEAFAKTLEYAARSLKLAGFHDIVFLGPRPWNHGILPSERKRIRPAADKQRVSRRRSRHPCRSCGHFADARHRPSLGPHRSPAARRRCQRRPAAVECRTRATRRRSDRDADGGRD